MGIIVQIILKNKLNNRYSGGYFYNTNYEINIFKSPGSNESALSL